jgi:Domain of unknown function (DUF397)
VDLNGAAWRTSSYSGGNGGQCVQVATITSRQHGPGRICAVRDSKDPGGAVLAFETAQWRRFTAGIKAGQFGQA